MDIVDAARLLSPMQISQAAIEITKVIVAKNSSATMTFAESARLMVLAVAPHVQVPLQRFTDPEFLAALVKTDLHLDTYVPTLAVRQLIDNLVVGRQQVLDPRIVKLNAMVAEIEGMAASGKQFEPIEA